MKIWPASARQKMPATAGERMRLNIEPRARRSWTERRLSLLRNLLRLGSRNGRLFLGLLGLLGLLGYRLPQ